MEQGTWLYALVSSHSTHTGYANWHELHVLNLIYKNIVGKVHFHNAINISVSIKPCVVNVLMMNLYCIKIHHAVYIKKLEPVLLMAETHWCLLQRTLLDNEKVDTNRVENNDIVHQYIGIVIDCPFPDCGVKSTDKEMEI